MERRNIPYKFGIYRSPSAANEGELSECVNLTPKNGELVTLQPPVPIGISAPSENHVLKYIHTITSDLKNYIFASSDDIISVSSKGGNQTIMSGKGEVNEITSVGNTLVISTETALLYALYKEGSYKTLGSKPPVIDISFLLNGEKATTTQEKVSLPESVEYLDSNQTEELSESNKNALNNKVFAHVNTFISGEAEKGNFTSSFFVRWAYTMLGKTYMASPPVLMRVNEGFFPLVRYMLNSNKELSFYMEAYTAKLICSFGTNVVSTLEDWKDIITGIEIYVSKPISMYDQNGEVKELSRKSSDTISYSVMDLPIEIDGTDEGIYAKRKLSTGAGYLTGFHKDKESYYKQFVNSSLFYMIRRFNFEDINSWNYVLNGSLDNIETLPQLPNSGFQEFDSYIPEGMFVYNGRLNMYGVKEKKYPFPIGNLVQYTNGFDVDGSETMKTYQWKIRFVKSSGEQLEITSEKSSYFYEDPTYLFYPDSNIDKVIVERNDGTTAEWATLPMNSHPYLQGSYWFNNFEGLSWSKTGTKLEPTESVVNEPNKIYTSDVNNPFIFPLEGINSVGTGDIIGLSTVTQALSQGQFGQFPLYVFSTSGIWAMEVNEEGLYSSVHPISRDVCNNKRSITQIDTAIIFSTDNGLKLLYGSDVQDISSKMNNENIDETDYNVLEDFSGLFVKDTDEFVIMLKNCSISYDYSHGLVHIYPSGAEKHFVYNLENGEYSTYIGHEGNIVSSVNDYPGMISQIGNELYSYQKQQSDTVRKGVLITRPISLSDPLSMKVINDIKLIYHKTKENTRCRYAMFASNDGNKWIRRTSLRGHSFKYFRFVIYTEMSDTDALQGMSIMYDYRRTNKLR